MSKRCSGVAFAPTILSKTLRDCRAGEPSRFSSRLPYSLRMRACAVVCVPEGRSKPFMVAPDEEFVPDQQARLVGDIQPAVWHRADAEAEAVPVHLLGNVDQEVAHPFFVLRQAATLFVLKETVQRDVRA